MSDNIRVENEIRHFSELEHIWWGTLTPAGQERYNDKVEKFVQFCKPSKDYRILEIGCGDGEFTRRLLPYSSHIIATDLTPEVIKRAKREIKSSKVKFLVENAEKLRFKEKNFDIVCGISILHHTDVKKALKEIYRVLKPGGQIFFTEPNYLNPVIFAGLHIPQLRKRMEFSNDETALIRKETEDILKSTGFKYVAVRNYDFLFPKTSKSLIPFVKTVGSTIEKIPFIKEISGSLILYAIK